MFVYLGNDTTVKKDDVIGIFDIEECSVSRITADFLNASQKQGRVVSVSDEMPKAFVVCTDKTYITNVSNSTINKDAPINILDCILFVKYYRLCLRLSII